MSRNNKNATRIEQARAMSKMRQAGNKGASATTPTHGKRFTYRNNPEILKRLADMKTTSDNRSSRGRTSGKKILESAGGAAKLQQAA